MNNGVVFVGVLCRRRGRAPPRLGGTEPIAPFSHSSLLLSPKISSSVKRTHPSRRFLNPDERDPARRVIPPWGSSRTFWKRLFFQIGMPLRIAKGGLLIARPDRRYAKQSRSSCSFPCHFRTRQEGSRKGRLRGRSFSAAMRAISFPFEGSRLSPSRTGKTCSQERWGNGALLGERPS